MSDSSLNFDSLNLSIHQNENDENTEVQEINSMLSYRRRRRQQPLSSIENIISSISSPRMDNLLKTENLNPLNISSLLKKSSPDDLVDLILHRTKSVDESTYYIPPELPSFFHFSEEEDNSALSLCNRSLNSHKVINVRVYPKKLSFGILSSGCWNIKNFTLTQMGGDANALVEIEAPSSPLVTMFSQKDGSFSSDPLIFVSTPCTPLTLQVKVESPEDQSDKEKVECELKIKLNGIITEVVHISAIVGCARLKILKTTQRFEIFPAIRKEESLLITNAGNVPLTLGVMGPESPLKFGQLQLSEKHFILDPDCAAYALKVYFESDHLPNVEEEGHLLLQTLPNGPVHRIPYLINNKQMSDFPIEADVSSLVWSKQSTRNKSISLKNSTNCDIPFKLIIESFNDSPSFSMFDGKSYLTQKNILFPSNSILTFRLYCKVKDPPHSPGPHGKLLIKLLNTPFKASISLSYTEDRKETELALLKHPSTFLMNLESNIQESFFISNSTRDHLSWRIIAPSCIGIDLSCSSGILKPLESKELIISLTEESYYISNATYEIVFEYKSQDPLKCSSSSIMLLMFQSKKSEESLQKKKNGGNALLTLEKTHITFSPISLGSEIVSKITIKNRTQMEETLNLHVFGGNNSSFFIPFSEITIRPRSYLRFPVQFKPESVGLHTSHIFIRNSRIQLTACVCGEAIE